MENPVHEEILNGLTIKIYQDENPQSPQEWGDEGLFLVGFHRDFYVLPPGVKRGSGNPDDVIFSNTREKYRKTHHIFPLEAYIHSGVVLALSQEGNFCDRNWDVSQLGAVFVSRAEWKTRDKARRVARGYVKTYNQYLSGDVYGYDIEPCQAGEIGSCWGFYGDYDTDGGALFEARAMVKHMTHNGETDHTGQRLFDFAHAATA